MSFFIYLHSTRGLDFTDEGFYLLAVTQGSDHVFNTPFHIPLSLLWNLSGKDIVLYRVFSFLILLALTTAWSKEAYRYFIRSNNLPKENLNTAIISTFGTLSFTGLGILTPSYNFLSYSGFLLVSLALFRMLNSTNSKKSYLATFQTSILFAIGITLSFFGKLSSSIFFIFALIMVFRSLNSFRKSLQYSLVIIVSTFLFSFYLINIMSFKTTKSLFQNGLTNLLIMDSTYQPLLSLMNLAKSFIALLAISFFLAIICYYLLPKIIFYEFTFLSKLYLLVFLSLILNLVNTSTPWLFSIFLLSLFWIALFSYKKSIDNFKRVSFGFFILIVCISGVIVGGNNGFYSSGMYFGPVFGVLFFWMLSNFVGTDEKKHRFGLILSILCIFSLGANSIVAPYRQPSLFNQRDSIQIANSELLLDESRANEIRELRKCLTHYSLDDRLILDFSNSFSPGLIFALGLDAPSNLLGTVWGYDGSLNLMKKTIEDLELKRSSNLLILVEKNNRELAFSRMQSLSLNLNIQLCESKIWEIYENQNFNITNQIMQ